MLDIGEDHVHAFGGAAVRQCPPDAARGAGHHRDALAELLHHVLQGCTSTDTSCRGWRSRTNASGASLRPTRSLISGSTCTVPVAINSSARAKSRRSEERRVGKECRSRG